MTGVKRRSGGSANCELRGRSSPSKTAQKLPLVHVTAVGTAREIVHTKQLEPRHCSVFDKDLLYFFVMRVAYRLKGGDTKSHQISRFPFVFIVKPDAISAPYHIYPFDTGGAAKGVFDSQADPFIFLEDYELEPTFQAAAGQIEWAFKSLESYFEGDLRRNILDGVPAYETVTHGYVDIATMARSGSNQPDERASAIEVAYTKNVPLKDNVLLAILPKQYLEEEGVSTNLDFISRLRTLGIRWEIYNWQPNTVPDKFQEEIADIAKKFFFEDLGLR